MQSKKTESDTRVLTLDATVETLQNRDGQGVRLSDIAKSTGLSRQAVYLHFGSRAELLIAATHHIDEQMNTDARLAAARQARTGAERLDRFIEAWGNYIPEIYSVAKALMAAQHSDPAAAAAWQDRMAALRDGCRAAIDALYRDGDLAEGWTRPKAIDALWTLLLVPNWESLTQTCGWSNADYVRRMKDIARRLFVRPG